MTTAEQILKQYWGYDDFRGIQREIIESICAGHDTLGLMPTGGGKSITFQVPALMMEGVCIVITPLIALMKDQVQNLRSRGIQASAIYSGMSHSEIVTTLENCIFGGVKILYISPERLASEIFQVKLRRIRVSFITVDEAHCISQWGHDFRPSYLEIAQIRKLVSAQNFPPVGGTEGGCPILALTATATPRVMQDIQDILTIDPERKFKVFKMSFERKNLAYIGREAADKYAELLHILNAVPGSAIVYVRSRSRTKEIADLLNASSPNTSSPNTQHPSPIIATHYHAGLDHSIRDERQEQWQRGEVRVMVATNAFGMGIDKADVRLVIHIDFPSSLEAYFQEAGRAGRDGKKAYAVLLYNSSDERKLEKRITDTFPEKDYIIKVYENLASFYQMAVGDGLDVTKTFDLDKFCRNFRHFPTQAEAALRLLDRAGYIHYDDEPDNASRLKFLIGRNELYRLVAPAEGAAEETPEKMRPVRHGGIGSRIMNALLEGGHNGVKMGVSIVPGVLVVCTVVMMLINGPSADGTYTGSAYEGIRLLPMLAGKIDFILKPLFGFSSPEAVGVPVTALGAAGASLSMTATLIRQGLAGPCDIAVFTAMCMCWSGYLSTHTSMMDSLQCKELIGKAIGCHTLGGLFAGIAAHWLYVLLTAIG